MATAGIHTWEYLKELSDEPKSNPRRTPDRLRAPMRTGLTVPRILFHYPIQESFRALVQEPVPFTCQFPWPTLGFHITCVRTVFTGAHSLRMGDGGTAPPNTHMGCTIWGLPQGSVLIVTGSSLRAEEKDRPLAYFIREKILELGESSDLPPPVYVISDYRYLHEPPLAEVPTISPVGRGSMP
ncbi:MAG: hypothetical protein U1D30_03230 [Planctomycetota bacterium]